VYLFIKTLYITTADPTLRTEEQVQLKEFATQVLQNLQTQMGTLAYLPIYTKVHDEVKEKRIERKANRMKQAIVNPQQSATTKIKKNQNKVLQRKRKAMEHDHRRIKQMVKIKHQEDKRKLLDPLLD
jgi:hypothetical protein